MVFLPLLLVVEHSVAVEEDAVAVVAAAEPIEDFLRFCLFRQHQQNSSLKDCVVTTAIMSCWSS